MIPFNWPWKAITSEINTNVCVITGVFGPDFHKLYPAPDGVSCYCFSNLKSLAKEAKRKGWHFVYVNFPLSNDSAISSFQSKYIKFLQFQDLPEYRELQRYPQWMYIDHKFYLKPEHIEKLLKIKHTPVLIRFTPRLKEQIWDEVNEAAKQERYQRFMPATLAYIQQKLAQGYLEAVRICNTGLMVYEINHPDTRRLVNEVYADLQQIGTSECQIVWAMVGQQYQSTIQTIEWNELPILWAEPKGGFWSRF